MIKSAGRTPPSQQPPMTFHVRNLKSGETFTLEARSAEHTWGLILCRPDTLATQCEIIGATQFGRRLWGEVG